MLKIGGRHHATRKNVPTESISFVIAYSKVQYLLSAVEDKNSDMPLMSQTHMHFLITTSSQSEQVAEYDQGYLVLVGEHSKREDTADQEDPYYYKVESNMPQ